MIQTWSEMDLRALTVYNEVDVVWKYDSSQNVSITWIGPENLLNYVSAEWNEDELIIDHSDRCEWARRLDLKVKAEIVSPSWESATLRGQGEFIMDSVWRGSNVTIETYASASRAKLRVDADTVTVKLHAGPAEVSLEGMANVIEAYSSGIGSLDASSCEAHRAFVNQSGVIPLHFTASDYAFVSINASGDAVIHGGLPEYLSVELNSTGELIEE
jgi:hypothetical protein